MNIGKACGIFLNIRSEKYSDNEKGQAIMQVCGMPTHYGITKAAMLRVIWYLMNICFELPADAVPPEGWETDNSKRE